ncbi:MAG: type II secretion system F family protein [Microthrixaceae bacterium]
MTLLLPVLLLAAAFGIAAWVLFGHLQEKQVARESLSMLDGYQAEGFVSPEPTAGSLMERVISPGVFQLSELVRRFSPVGYADEVRQKYVHAGRGEADSVDRFLAMKAMCCVAAVVAGVVIFILGISPFSGLMKLMFGGGVMFGLFVLPDKRLDASVKTRQGNIQRQLPDTMDLLTISVEAGLGFEQALERVIDSVPGELSDEYSRMMGEVRAGASRADALRAMDERVGIEEIKTFAMAIIQADAYGISIGKVLRGQADEMRIKRRQRAQEQAMKTPVKMLLPITLFIFPVLLIVILAPAFMNIVNNMGE